MQHMHGRHARGAAGQDDDFVGHGNRFADVVRDEHGGLVFAADDFVDVVADAEPGLIIERGKGLVEKQNLRIDRQRADECGALPHAARELRGIVFQKIFQPVFFRKRKRPRPVFGRVGFLNFQGQKDIFFNGAPREEFVFLKHITEGYSFVFHLAAGRLQQPRSQRQKGGFSAARRADDRREFAFRNGKIEVFHGGGFTLSGMVVHRYVIKS